ncbi:hypothetical protein [Phytohabitans rumicis]|uniref:Uncharacterized protein n=1 Tax=Phytohabitans rumicis TaxID=1076125 RepID=A0A6V8LKD8_9ACTN|nr:hypothetical protein [Phytohabitans rumicis]GFJ96020.1 hypothetical protein Prum_096620 [Phytohabitans rumicis]
MLDVALGIADDPAGRARSLGVVVLIVAAMIVGGIALIALAWGVIRMVGNAAESTGRGVLLVLAGGSATSCGGAYVFQQWWPFWIAVVLAVFVGFAVLVKLQ